MMRRKNMFVVRILALLLIVLSIGACAPTRYQTVIVPIVEPEPQSTEEGGKLAPVRKPALAYLEVIERSPNVKSVTRVTNNEDDSIQIGPPVLSPVDDSFVYHEMLEDKKTATFYSNIWKQSVGSFAKTRITYSKRLDWAPAYTSDGQSLVFGSDRAGLNSSLWRIKVSGGGGITKITSGVAVDYTPCVSPKDGSIAYTSNPPGAEESQIWVVNANGSLPTQLREGESPQISPDGTKILFLRWDKDSGRKQLWWMNIDGSNETQLTINVDYDVDDPKWSPDGKWIVFASDEGFDSNKKRNYDIWLIASDGLNKTQLTTNGSWDDAPCWDGNGTFIYFRSNRGGAWNIWRFEPILP